MKTPPTKLVEKWMDNLCRRDIDRIVEFYSKNAILVPTLSKEIRQGEDEIRDYFIDFVGDHPNLCGEIIFEESQDMLPAGIVVSGVYNFSWGEEEKEERTARFTYVFSLGEGRKWKVLTHHSSAMPGSEPTLRGV